MRPSREDTQPWYRQFWPWFLISIPAATVVAGIITLNLAMDSNDGLVSDDYYKEGLAIHKDAARAQMARDLGLLANLQYDPDAGTVEVTLNDAAIGSIDTLMLNLVHPTRANRDQHLEMKGDGHGRYLAKVAALEPANWRLSIEPPSSNWRLSGRLSLPTTQHVELR